MLELLIPQENKRFAKPWRGITNPAVSRYKFHTFPLNPAYFPASDGPLAMDQFTIRGLTDDVNSALASGSLMARTVGFIDRLRYITALINDL
jgi:hypothetical protein